MTVERRIDEISLKYCSEYPDIETVTYLEKLYAIESTLGGISAANEDCHKVIQTLRKKLNMSSEQLIELWEEVNKE